MREIILPWPEWKLGKLLGRGAFGEVYQAEREEFGNKTYSAIKIMRIPADQSDVDMLENSGIEARSYLEGMISDISNEIVLMQSLKGAPNIVGIEDYKILESEEELQWIIFIRMELLEDLNHYKKRHELSYEEIIHLGCDICNALNICRRMKIVHRDIKPSNIFISRFGDYKLGDFGISKHTEHTKSALSTQKGTISYMAPEIYKGEKYDHTVDIFSLGVVLFQLANNGRLPFYPPAGTNVLPGYVDLALSKRNSGEPFPDPANGGKELGDIIRKACHKDPSQRYLEPGQMRQDLQKLIKSEKPVWDEEDEEKTILLKPVNQDKQDVSQKKMEDLKTKKDKKSGNHYKWIIMSVIVLLGVSAVSVTFLKLKNKSDPIVIETERETESELETKAETESETEKRADVTVERNTEKESDVLEEVAETEETVEMMPEYNAEEYVILGEYVNLTVEVEPIEISDEQIQAVIDVETIEVLTEGTVEAGDIANIDYEGKLDGVSFDGGTATGYDLDIGSGTFIPGFEDALIGIAIGETKDIDLTFPEEYDSGELAGKDVVFTVTVNSVKRVPTLTDEVAQKVAGKTVEEYKENILQNLMEQALNQRKTDIQNELISKATENATITEYPKANLEYTINHGISYYEYIANMNGMSFDDFLAANGMDYDSFRAEMEPIAKQALAQEMVLLAIAKAEGIELSDEEYETGLSDLAAQQKLTDSQTLLDVYGETYVRSSLTQQKVVQYLYENAEIAEVS